MEVLYIGIIVIEMLKRKSIDRKKEVNVGGLKKFCYFWSDCGMCR